MAQATNRKELLEEEWYHVRYSGEIPEIALHSSIHYLTEDPAGPGIALGEDDLEVLTGAASARYREIIFRDVTPSNRGTTIYRGVLRTICNWRRYKRFCRRHDRDEGRVGAELAEKLAVFLAGELREARQGIHSGSINCSYEDLASLAVELGMTLPEPGRLRGLCRALE